MVWKHLEQTGKPRNFIFENNKLWWNNNINKIQVQITKETLQQAFPYIKDAYENKKPYCFHISNNLRGTISKILNQGNHPTELLIQSYGKELVNINFDSNKINNLTENAVHLYFDWNDVPEKLKEFVLNKKEE